MTYPFQQQDLFFFYKTVEKYTEGSVSRIQVLMARSPELGQLTNAMPRKDVLEK